MSLVWEIVLSLVLVGLNVALVRFLAPPRIGLVPRLTAERGHRGRRLRLAVQSLDRDDFSGDFVITLWIVGSGKLEISPSLFSGRQLEAYIGTEADRDAVQVFGGQKEMEIRIGRLRPMKTWVFDIPCSDDTLCIQGRVEGKNRQLSLLFPALQSIADELPAHRPGRFVFEWRAQIGDAQPSRPTSFGALSIANPSQWGRTFETKRGRVGLVVVALSACGYALGTLILDQLGLVPFAEPLLELLLTPRSSCRWACSTRWLALGGRSSRRATSSRGR
ncbi:MAG: hypothetical protein R3B82_21700 [Sandaracinaceae bacterium]